MKTGVILMTRGFPDREDQLDRFLENSLPDNVDRKTAFAELANGLRKIGGECPQLGVMKRQREALADTLEMKTYLGLLHWEPSIYTAIARAREDRIGRLVGIVLNPHYSKGTVGTCHALLKKVGKDMQILPVWSWATQPFLIDYWASQMKEGATVLFTAPKIEQEKAGLYLSEIQETIRAIQTKVSIEAHIAFHTTLPMESPAIGPDIWEAIKLLRKKDELIVAPIGFTADQLEVLFTLDRLYAKKTRNLGIRWTRLPLPNDNPVLIAALARVVHSVL